LGSGGRGFRLLFPPLRSTTRRLRRVLICASCLRTDRYGYLILSRSRVKPSIRLSAEQSPCGNRMQPRLRGCHKSPRQGLGEGTSHYCLTLSPALGSCTMHCPRLWFPASACLPHPWGRTPCIHAVVSLEEERSTSLLWHPVPGYARNVPLGVAAKWCADQL